MADKHFLDYDGLSQFFNGLKQKFYQKPSDGIPKTDLANAVQTSLGKADNALPKSGGTMTGAINMGSKKITSLGIPTNDADAATKKYVDDGFIPSSGGTVIGNLGAGSFLLCNRDGGSIVALETDGTKLKAIVAAGDGPLTCIECATPTADNDAANKKYVDDKVSGTVTTSYVDSAISTALTSAVVYKGTKAAVANLPATGNKTGDMWNVSADGMNYVWDGTNWDAQAPTFSITSITNAEINTILAST